MPMSRIAAVLLLLGTAPVAAQTVTVRVRNDTGPIAGALIRVLDLTGTVRTRQLADENGQARLTLPDGSFNLRVDGIGYATRLLEQVTVKSGSPITLDVVLERKPFVIDEIAVRADRSGCQVEPKAGSAAAELWTEARKNLELVLAGRHHRATPLQIVRFTRDLNEREVVTREETSQTRGFFVQPFSAASSEFLLTDGFVQTQDNETIYYAPDAALFLSDAFAGAYCFKAVLPPEPKRGEAASPLVGIRFQPQRVDKPSIEGTVWLDGRTGYVSSLTFNYLGVPMPNDTDRRAGGRLAFRRAAHGLIIVEEWSIRMPRVATILGSGGSNRQTLRGFLEVGARISEPTDRPRTGAVIVGRLFDSTSNQPLRNAQVAIGNGPVQTSTDSAGRFTIRTEESGDYTLHLRHPRLELLGLAVLEQTVSARAGDTTRVFPQLPNHAAVIAAACPVATSETTTSLFAGRIVDAAGARQAGARLAARWQELRKAGPGLLVQEQEARLESDALGIFRFCGLPTDRPAELFVSPPERIAALIYRLPAPRASLSLVDRVTAP
ncbi:MAG: carboxypeptidase regulatory-like domain-containing protein [Gemmatimonadales bacterium]